MINEHLYALAQKFPQTKFIKSVSSVCIPNYPDKNLPTIFVYCEGDMKKQYIGAAEFGTSSITLPGTINVAQVISSRGTYRAKTDVQSRDMIVLIYVMSVAVGCFRARVEAVTVRGVQDELG